MEVQIEKSQFMDRLFTLDYPTGTSHMDGFPEDLREVVNDHWAQFPPQHPMVVQIFALFYIFVTFVCVFGNFLVIFVFAYNKELRIPVSFLKVD